MKKYLAFDTETTGLIDFKADLMAPHQPRIVQLAAEIYDEEGNALRSLNAIIKPDGWDKIEEGAFKAHGITVERAQAEGRCMKEVLAEFNEMKAEADARFAYNIPYDKKMLAREAGYHNIPHDSAGIESYCVMKMATPICNMPPTGKMVKAGFNKPKSPKLIEAYRFFFDKDFEAHDAMNDVRATKEIFFLIKNNHPEHFNPEIVKVYKPTEETPIVEGRIEVIRPEPTGRDPELPLAAGEVF